MTAFLVDLIRNHGWHAVGELAALVLITVFTAFYATALLRGRVRATECPSCGRITSRARSSCPRCGAPMEAA